MCISRYRPQRGLTLLELLIFIVVVGIALAGVLTVLNIAVKSSADPLVRKQMLAIAEALLEEVQLQTFTWCDPDDPNAATATSTLGCTASPNGAVEIIGKETINGVPEARGSLATPLDNVSDYNGENVTTNIVGTAGMPAGYSANIAVADTSAAPANRLGGITADADVLLITVTVCRAVACPSPGADNIVLEGYRLRHSPNMLP